MVLIFFYSHIVGDVDEVVLCFAAMCLVSPDLLNVVSLLQIEHFIFFPWIVEFGGCVCVCVRVGASFVSMLSSCVWTFCT